MNYTNHKRLSYDVIKQVIEVGGNKLLTIEYINAHQKLEYICGYCKQNRKTTWNNWQQGKRCPCLSNCERITDEFVHASFESEGYTLLSTFVNSLTTLHYKCPFGHYGTITWGNWYQGKRCGTCAPNKKLLSDNIKQSFESEGYTLLSTYVNSRTHVKYVCPNGNYHKITWNNWQQGVRCPCDKCGNYKGTSPQEREIQSHIEIHHPDVLMFRNDRSLMLSPKGFPLELDVWMPGIKKAIEYGADYYHSDEYIKQCDAYKVQYCKDNDIDLLRIIHNVWIKNKDFNMIDNFINNT